MKRTLFLIAFVALTISLKAQNPGFSITEIHPIPAGTNSTNEWSDLFAFTTSTPQKIARTSSKSAEPITEPVLNLATLPRVTSGIIHIDLGKAIESKIVLTDEFGKTLILKTLSAQKFTVDLSDLNAGLYWFTIETNLGTVTKQISLTK